MPLAGPFGRLDFQDVAVLGPDIEAAADAAIGADGLGAADARFAHGRFGFGNLHDRAVAGLRLDAFDHVDHAVERRLRQRGEEAGVAEHRFFHQRIARADRDAVAAGDATRFADGRAAIPQHARMRVFPADRERFVHLHVLAGLHAAAAENALVGIVAIEGIGDVHLVRLGLERDMLVLDGEQLRGVVDRAIAVVVVADGAVEQVVAEDAVERLALRRMRRGRASSRPSCPAETMVAQARTSLPSTSTMQVSQVWIGPKLRVIANLRQLRARAIDRIDQPFARLRFIGGAVDRNGTHGLPPSVHDGCIRYEHRGPIV